MTTQTDTGIDAEPTPERAPSTHALSLPAVLLVVLVTLALGIGIGWRIWGGDDGSAANEADEFAPRNSSEVTFLGVLGRDTDTNGVLITRVVADSPADIAGIHVGDLVVTLDGNPVEGITDVATEVRSRQPGDEVTIGVTRDGEQLELTATLGSAPRRR
jgi:S1-C subfamily serine protease